MSIEVLFFGTLIIIGVIGWWALGHNDGTGSIAKLLLFIAFAVFAAGTVACLYLAFAKADKGAGPMMFLAVPLGLIAWIAFSFLRTAVKHEEYWDLNVEDRQQYTLEKLDQMQADFEEVISYNDEQVKRFWISPLRRKKLRDELSHAEFMLDYIAKMRNKAMDKSIYRNPAR